MSEPLISQSPDAEPPTKRKVEEELRLVSGRVGVFRRLAEIWRYRQLLVSLVRKELKVKYKGSALGFIWTLLNPILKLAVYYFVFSVIMANGIPLFVIFLLCGLLIWNFFSEALAAATGSVVGNGSIIKKVSFPREILPLAAVGASVINFLLQSIVLLGALAVFRHPPAWEYVPLLVPALIALVLFTSALAIFLAAVNVKFRDTQHLLELLLMLWFWLTPIVYPVMGIAQKLSENNLEWLYTWVYLSNPIAPIVLTFQRAIYGMVDVAHTDTNQIISILPDVNAMWYLGHLGFVAALSAVLLAGAFTVFGRLEGDFAEEL